MISSTPSFMDLYTDPDNDVKLELHRVRQTIKTLKKKRRAYGLSPLEELTLKELKQLKKELRIAYKEERKELKNIKKDLRMAYKEERNEIDYYLKIRKNPQPSTPRPTTLSAPILDLKHPKIE